MQNPFIPNTISYKLFEEMKLGGTKTLRQIQSRFGTNKDFAQYMMKRDSWLYYSDTKSTNKKGTQTFTLTTRFKMKPERDIDQNKFQRQISNTERWIENGKQIGL